MLNSLKRLFKSDKVEIDNTPDTIFTLNVLNLKTREQHERFWETLNLMYAGFLKDDPQWHFFYEGDYSHIRFSKRYVEHVCEYLRSANFTFSEIKRWIDDSPTVEEFKEEFIALFHNFSVIAIKFKTNRRIEVSAEELEFLADRIIHCFLNHMYYKAMDMYTMDNIHDTSYELIILSNIAKNRAWYLGRLQGILMTKDRLFNKDKEKK